ncbi:hypothetical protein [Anabaena sp. CS-542/02]|uniref:hypothetical protein n=1 Tax=Anabaena sp. CS-542/02 TaxID=3021719 RepID=UPI00233087F2|nr:hypothetical protein [Anabaena sp. CS-542/02]MDB9448060.1 hypothetical protein [Anabaena sp. CS-542/02]
MTSEIISQEREHRNREQGTEIVHESFRIAIVQKLTLIEVLDPSRVTVNTSFKLGKGSTCSSAGAIAYDIQNNRFM